jgi:OOP family OmpA-OmpF porin
MKKSFRSTASLMAVAASLALAGVAQAQTTNTSAKGSNNSGFAYGSGGSYFDFNAGKSDFSLDNGFGPFNSDKRDTAYSAHFGSYFNDILGMEIGYTDFGSVDRAGGRTKAQGINLSLVGKFAVSPSFNFLGKIGTTYSDTDTSANPLSGVQAGSDDGFGLSYGIGAELAFAPQWSAVVLVESHKLRFAGGNKDRVSLATLGVRYSF